MDLSRLKTIVWKESDQYVAQSLNVDVASFGDSKQEALSNLREALELYFEDADIKEVQRVEDVEIAVV